MATYFITYNFTTYDVTGFGNLEIARKTDINTFKDIQEIEKQIMTENKSFTSVLVLNYIKLADKAPQGIIKKIMRKERTW